MRAPYLLAISLCAWVLGACHLGAPSGICELRADEVRIFPQAGASEIPVNIRVRAMLSAQNAPETDILLFDGVTGEPLLGDVIETPTDFGTVLEFVPDFELPALSQVDVELVDRNTGRLVEGSSFVTAAFAEIGSPTAEGPVVLGPVPSDERRCCAAQGCRDGTAISTPKVISDAAGPQLVLLDIEEVSSTACGAAVRLVDIVPVVQRGSASDGLDAESDRTLAGCFQVSIRDQFGRIGQPDEVVCTRGFVFEPGSSESCRSDRGCSGGAPGPQPALPFAVISILFISRRRVFESGR